MEANQILQADLLDIIFEGKNKSYGAYALRRSYNSRIIKSLFITLLFIPGFYGGTILAGKKSTSISPEIFTKWGNIPEAIPELKLPEPPKLPEAKQVAIEKTITNIYVPPRITPDELVRPDEKVTTLNPEAAIGTEEIKIGNKVGIVHAPSNQIGTSVTDFSNIAPVKENDEPFVKVEKEAEFIGGAIAWRKYLVRKLNPQEAAEQGAAPGLYTVIVRFVVSTDGSISDVAAETNHGFGMEKDAITVIKNGPNWIPAKQNGSSVKAYRRQPITFQVL